MADPPGSEVPNPRFAKLPPGRTRRSAEETALHRRRRLMRAMVDVVSRRGYEETTLRELVSVAGVSNTSFYEQFDSLQECFLATHDELVQRGIEGVSGAFQEGEGLGERLGGAFRRYVELALANPEATHFLIVDSLSLGPIGIAHRQRSIEAYELMFQRTLEDESSIGDQLSPVVVKAILGGMHRVVYRRVRDHRVEQLRECIDPLVAWSLSYIDAGPQKDWHLPAAGPLAPKDKESLAVDEAAAEMWDERPGTIAKRLGLSPRERMVRAAAMVVAEQGYEKLSIPAITRAAAVSNKTFYAHFQSAHEAFIEALNLLDQQALARIGGAIAARGTWPDSVVAGLKALLTYASEKPLLSRLPLIESLRAGADARDRVDQIQDRLAFMFNPEAVAPEVGEPLPAVVLEAITGGVFAVIQHEVVEGRAKELPALLGDLSFFALAPLTPN